MDAGTPRIRELGGNLRVRLAGVAASLRVTDDHPAHEPLQHRGGDLTGVGARQVVMDVLRSDQDA